MAYASVISQPGSAARNIGPVLDALAPLIETQPLARRVLELASFPYEHIRGYAERWPDVHFNGTARDAGEVGRISTNDLPANVAAPVQLDVTIQHDWDTLARDTPEPYDGVVMLNLVHCMPEGAPEEIFRNLSPRTQVGQRLLRPQGWIAAYGAYLADDGSFRSPGDAAFDASHIKSVDPRLGLRSPQSITDMAAKWGFVEESRRDMPSGNLWIVWRATEL